MARRSWVMAGAVVLALLLAAPAAAVVVVPPDGRSDYSFYWLHGPSPIIGIDYQPEDVWSLTLARPSHVAFTVTDAFLPGDAFGLILDGSPTAWTTEGLVGPFFQAAFEATLPAGTTLFSLLVTMVAPGIADGEARASFDVAPVAPVPVPAAALLLLAALSGLGLAARRRSGDARH